MKRIWYLALIATAIPAFLAGCGNDSFVAIDPPLPPPLPPPAPLVWDQGNWNEVIWQ